MPISSKKKYDPIKFVQSTLALRYSFKLQSAYKYTVPGKRKPTEYRVYGKVEDKKKPQRRISTDELNRLIKKDAPRQFMRVSYAQHLRTSKMPNYFKFRFALNKVK